MSRFGRGFYETIRTVRRLRDDGVGFHSPSEQLDLESPNGRLMFNVLASCYGERLRTETQAAPSQ